MNKRIQRGFSKENDDGQYDDGSSQQYHGYTGHMSNTDMPSVQSNSNIGSTYSNGGTRQSKTSSGIRNQTWKNQQMN